MNNIKQVFSIKDLEHLCGVKAHTIRIWEKRYNLLDPQRTNTNIRTYDLKNLQKLLNVTYLVNSGYKISRISKLDKEEINASVLRIVSGNSVKNQAINSFKISMLNYDQELFLETYEQLIKKKSFHEIFYDVFIPFLNEIGLLWQTNTITPSHEHFITHLIKQKLILNIDKLQLSKPIKRNKMFILFLPEHEIHDLGLMYVQYELLNHGYRAVFLGTSIPLECLPNPKNFHEEVIFISYFTIRPEKDTIANYINEFDKIVNKDAAYQFWMLGKQTKYLPEQIPPNQRHFASIFELTQYL